MNWKFQLKIERYKMQNGAKLKDKVSDHSNNGKGMNSINTNGFKELTKDNLLQVLKLMI